MRMMTFGRARTLWSRLGRAATLAIVAAGCGQAASDGPPPLRFSAIPDQNSTEF
jgi:ABC-type phosphate/phosphonate transport system substrate-binding protein